MQFKNKITNLPFLNCLHIFSISVGRQLIPGGQIILHCTTLGMTLGWKTQHPKNHAQHKINLPTYTRKNI